MDANENGQQESSEEGGDDKLDFMEQEELEMIKDTAKGKVCAVGKRNAIDRTADTNVYEMKGRDDDADNTVFIDKLPKDER